MDRRRWRILAWSTRAALVALVSGGVIAGLAVGDNVSASIVEPVKSQDLPPYKVGLSGSVLNLAVAKSLASTNARREGRIDREAANMVFLENVSFDRSAGGVIARGSIIDLAGPRRLNTIIDAFDAEKNYLLSSSSSVDTKKGSTSFSASLNDQDEFQTFAVRFLDANMEEVILRTQDNPNPNVPPLLVEDPVRAKDMDEVSRRLIALGYASNPAGLKEEAVITAVVKRFRRDHKLGGNHGVSIGDLLALREVSSVGGNHADLSDY